MSESESTERVTVGAKVDQWKRKELRVIAAKTDTTVSNMLRSHIDDVLDDHGRSKN